VTKGRIADLLECQGHVAEARRLLEQEVLLVYEALGDQRSVAVTKGQIAAMLPESG
jgi:hypothetical protein